MFPPHLAYYVLPHLAYKRALRSLVSANVIFESWKGRYFMHQKDVNVILFTPHLAEYVSPSPYFVES